MKSILSAFVLVFFISPLSGQDLKTCGTTHAMSVLMEKHPERIEKMRKLRQESNAMDEVIHKKRTASGNEAHKISKLQQSTGTVYTIPVVFHVLHQGGGENISNAQIIDAVAILTRDYRKRNADTTMITPAFQALAADVEIEFKLATLDPNGNCTNGIIRHYDADIDWGWASFPNYTWDPTKYLNIYTVKSIEGGTAAAYTYLPGSWSSGDPNDCIISIASYVGSIGSGSQATARVLTHEVGHWLDLDHVWGGTNNPGVSCGDDGVSDTPVTMGYTTCNMANSMVCTPGVEENIQNYMEYSYCCMMFTQGQSNRMRNTIINNTGWVDRPNLVTPANLLATGVTNPLPCMPLADFKVTKTHICTNSTITFSDNTPNAQITSWQWSFPGGTPATSNDSIPVVSYANPGDYAVTYTATNAAGSDTISKTALIHVLSNTAYYQNVTTESFESISVPNSDWTVVSYDSIAKWKQTSAAAATGNNAMMIDNFNNIGGAIDELYSPGFNLNSIYATSPPVSFTFKLAYQQRNSADMDRLQVYSSTNCGLTWTLRYSKAGSVLATAGVNSAPFVPSTSDWRMETVNVVPVQNQSNVIFKFVFTSDAGTQGNNIYIDDINMQSNPVGIAEYTNSVSNLNVFPNPGTNNIHITFDLNEMKFVRLSLTDVLGREVEEIHTGNLNAGSFDFTISSKLSKGIYFLKMSEGERLRVRKIMIE